MNRRDFFTEGFLQMQRFLKENLVLEEKPQALSKDPDYFESVYTCYPLLSEAPYPLLVKTANELGISTENKTKLELAREIFGKEGQ